MTADACLDCGGTLKVRLRGLEDTRFGAPGKFDIAVCTDCGMEQTTPRPSQADLNALYKAHYNFGGSRSASLYGRLRSALFGSLLYRLWLAMDGDVSFHSEESAPPGLRLLDVGCNEGRGLALYRRNGFEVEGLELNPAAAAQARARGFTVHEQALDDFHPAAPYDVVVLSNVLEHALDPRAMVGCIAHLLVDNGALWVSCPNNESWLRRLFGRHWINWHVPYHITHFSAAGLKALLRAGGFETQACRQATPALWVAQSVIAALFARPGQATTALRRPLLVILLMMAARGILFPLLIIGNRLGHGDCLVLQARKV